MFLKSSDLDLSPFKLKTDYYCPGEHSRQFWLFSTLCFQVRSTHETNERTNGQAIPVMWPVRMAA